MTDEHQTFLEEALPHLDAVWNVARRAARFPLDPEDLVQETYLRAFSGFRGRRGGDMRSWLVAICLNASRTHYRRLRRRPKETFHLDEELASTDDTEAEALGSIDKESIEEALRDLPEPQRQAILLVDVAGLTAQQAADAIGAPRGTILARVHRGRRKLAQLLRAKDAIDGV